MAKLERARLQPVHARLLSALTLARIAVAELDLRGFTVLALRLQGEQPTVVVRPSRHTEGLQGERVRTGEGLRDVFQARFCGCVVEWSARGRWPWPAGRGH
jgi:hypothetical protein